MLLCSTSFQIVTFAFGDSHAGQLVERVRLELNIAKEAAKDHPRCAQTRINSFLRDAQKKVRSKHGYGDGKKSNEFNVDAMK